MARARSAKERKAISQGLKEFWDKKGRSVLAVGGAGLAVGGALALAAKSGKLPKGKGVKGMRNGNAPLLPSIKQGGTVEDLMRDDLTRLAKDRISPRMLPGAAEVGTGAKDVVKYTPPANGIQQAAREVFQRGRKLSGGVVNTGRATRQGFDEGYAVASTEGGVSYFIGRQASKIDRRGKQMVNDLGTRLKRRIENRG